MVYVYATLTVVGVGTPWLVGWPVFRLRFYLFLHLMVFVLLCWGGGRVSSGAFPRLFICDAVYAFPLLFLVAIGYSRAFRSASY